MKATTRIIPPDEKDVVLDELYTPLGSVFIGEKEYPNFNIEDEIKWNGVVRTIYLAE